MEKYRISYSEKIVKVVITRESESSYWSDKFGMERKSSSWHQYFDTFEEAKNYLINKYIKAIKGLQNNLESAENKLKDVESLTEN